MTYKHYNQAIDATLPFDSGTQRSIFLEACTRADNQGIVRVGQTELATITMYSPATIKREFVRLQELRLIEKEAHGRYQITLPNGESEKSKPNTLSCYPDFVKWIEDSWGKTPEKQESITVADDADDLPDCFYRAVAEGILVEGQRGMALEKISTNYIIHIPSHEK